MMDAKLKKKLRDALAAAGARVARAELNLDLARKALEAARQAVLDVESGAMNVWQVRLQASNLNSRVYVIKTLRALVPGMTLKQAVDIEKSASVDPHPHGHDLIGHPVSYEAAQAMRKSLEEVGAQVAVVPA